MNWKFWEKKKELELKEVKPIEIDLNAIPGQGWHIKKRGEDGKVYSIDTLKKPPTAKDVAMYGPGSYTIFTVKPTFKKFNTVIVAAAPLNPSKVKKKIKISRHMAESSNLIDPDNNITQPHAQNQKIEHESTRAKEQVQVPEESEAPLEIETPPQYKPRQRTQIKTPYIDSFLDMLENCPNCPHCEETMYPFGHLKECHFCKQLFHANCLAKHECSNSYICPICEKRIRNDSTFLMEYCNKQFCSAQCSDMCMQKNNWRTECNACKGSKYHDMSSDEENDEDTCGHCGASLETQEFGFECEEECDATFCSRRCGKNYHLSIGEWHELFRVEL